MFGAFAAPIESNIWANMVICDFVWCGVSFFYQVRSNA